MNNYLTDNSFFVANAEAISQICDLKMEYLYQQIEIVETVLIVIVTIIFVIWFLRTLRDEK